MAHDSARYTHGHHDSVLRSHRWRTAANSAGYLLDELRPDMRILDVGCGPGTISADLAELVPQGDVVGVDAAAGVLEQAREFAERRGVTNVRFTTGDGYALDHPDASFDVVHAHQVLQHVADPVRMLREMRRVCRPGGLVAVRDVDYAATLWYPHVPELDDWLALYERVARANGGEPDAGRRLHAWAHRAGFTDVTATTTTWCFASPQERAWWGDLWAERTTASTYAEVVTGGGHASADELARIAAGWRTWAGDRDGWINLLHGEVLCRR